MAGFGFIEPLTNTSAPTSIAGFTLPFVRTIGGPLAYGSYGILLSISLAFCLLSAVSSEKVAQRYLAIILSVVCFLGFIVGQSRSTFLSLSTTICIVTIYVYHQQSVSLGYIFNPLYRLGRVLIPILVVPLSYVLYTIRPRSVELRLDQIAVATEQIFSYPLIGSTRELIIFETGGYIIHNVFFATGALFGLPGLLLLISIWILTVRSGITSTLYIRDSALSVVLLAAVLGTTVEVLLYSGLFSKVMWFALSVTVSGSSILLYNTNP